jgi:hypothetical protein
LEGGRASVTIWGEEKVHCSVKKKTGNGDSVRETRRWNTNFLSLTNK